MTTTHDSWSVASAKARLSEVIQRAGTHGPQIITRNGRDAAVVVSAEAWARLRSRSGSLADFFRSSPLTGSGVVIERQRDFPDDPAQ